MWKCPDCGKSFQKHYHWHDCLATALEYHFKDKPGKIRELYEKLVKAVDQFGEIEVMPLKSSIKISSGKTFLTIRPRKNHLLIEFILPENVEVDTYRIYTSVKILEQRRLHAAALVLPEEVDPDLIEWLKSSFEFRNE